MFIAWVLFPLVMLAVCLGCGLAVERIGGWRLSGGVLLAVGLAVVIVLATVMTDRSDTAPLTTWLVVLVALAGYASSWRRASELRPEPWSAAVGFGIFAFGAAPVVLSGNATFLGYFVDSDTAFHLVLAADLLAHGRDLSYLPAVANGDAVAGVVRGYIQTAYPTGADVGLGALRPLVGQDSAWIYQPYLAVIMALGGVVLDELLDGVVRSRAFRAACAFIAAQAGLTYAFYLQGGIKEVTITVLITLTALLVVQTLRQPFRVRALAPLIVVAIAELDVYSISVVPWLGPPLVVLAAVVAWRARGARRLPPIPELIAAAAAAVIAAVLAAPVIGRAARFVSVASAVLTQKNELGDLAAPLSLWHIFGIWPSGDFRYAVDSGKGLALALLLVGAGAAIAGLAWMIRRRSFGPLLLLGGNAIAAAYLLSRASPYAASKVLMILSTGVVTASMLGGAALHQSGRRALGWALAATVGAGVLWTNVLAYHDSAVLPQNRFRELAYVGHRFAGQGPAFYDLWDTFAVYFLRDEAVSAPNTFAGPAELAAGQEPRSPNQLVVPWDPDILAPSYVQRFPLLIVDRSPLLSRPPADYELAYQGHYYDVWRRQARPRVLAHVSFGTGESDPPGGASCSTVMATAARARRLGAQLAFVRHPALPTLIPTEASHPAAWSAHRAQGDTRRSFLFLGQTSGTLVGTVHVTKPGRYRVWLQGSLSRPADVSLDGRAVGSVAAQIGNAGQFNQIGSVELPAGDASVRINRPPSGLGPGNVASGELLGPLVLANATATPSVQRTPARAARKLCGQPLEWLEIVG